jgi:hypothetical protein
MSANLAHLIRRRAAAPAKNGGHASRARLCGQDVAARDQHSPTAIAPPPTPLLTRNGHRFISLTVNRQKS